jgi:tape measure domain-containing protein
MAGEIAAAYIALLPSLQGFGSQIVAQGGPQIRAASEKLGNQSGTALGGALGGAASKAALPAVASINAAVTEAGKQSQNWLTESATVAVKNVALYGSMYAGIQLVKQGVQSMFDSMVGFNSELQQADIGFTQILGSSQAAKTELAWVKDFAKETPFNFQDVLKYDQQLQAMIGDSKEAHDALQAAGDAAAGLGRGTEGVASIALALGQIATKGKLQSQELVLQLAQVGINGVKILADQLGTSTADIQDRMQQGILDSATYLPILIKGIEQQYAGLLQQDSATLAGVWSNIQDTLQQQLAAAGKPLFDELSKEATSALAALNSPEVQKDLDAFGQFAATGAKDLQGLVGWAWNGRDAFLALGVIMASRALWNSERVKTFRTEVAALRPAFTGASNAAQAATVAQAEYEATLLASEQANARSNAALIERASAQAAAAAAEREFALAQGNFVASGATEITTDERVEAATVARAAALERLRLAEAGIIATDLDAALSARQLAAADDAAAAAATANAEAQSIKAKALTGLKGILGSVGQIAGLAIAADGLNRVTTNANDAGQAVLGVAEATGGAALAGAAFGTSIPLIGTAAGAAIGGVVGLTSALINLQAAQDASNKDTAGTEDALTHIGVSADTAAKFLSHLTNAQLDQLGGSQAVVNAIQNGGAAYDALVVKLRAAKAAQDEVVAADKEAADYAVLHGSVYDTSIYDDDKKAAEGYAAALRALNGVAAEAAYSQFNATEAANAATGAYGQQSLAAYQAALAIGTIPSPLEQTGIAAEGAAGLVGYLLNSLTGLPVNTPINFSTNATDVLQKIYALQGAISAISPNDVHAEGRQAAYIAEINALEKQLRSVLTSPVSVAHVRSPSGGGGGGSAAANAAALAAKAAAEAAAQKLKQDRQAQQQFSDAFGTIMQSALEGDFDQYRSKLTDEITSLTRDGYKKAADALTKLSPVLDQAALDYAALTNKIKAATDAESSLTSKMHDQYTSTVDLISGLGKVTDAQSFGQLTYLLSSTTDAATQYQDILTQLKAEGLSADLWDQLAQGGPQSLGLAQSILAQGQTGVDQLNSLSGGLVDAADSMGTLVSQSMYQQGADAMRAYIDGLNSQQAALDAQLVTIGNNILTQAGTAITRGTTGLTPISSTPTQTANTYQVALNVNAADFGDIQTIQDFIAMLESSPTTQLVNQAGTVTD